MEGDTNTSSSPKQRPPTAKLGTTEEPDAKREDAAIELNHGALEPNGAVSETGLVAPLHELRGASRDRDRGDEDGGASRIVEVKELSEISKTLGLNARSSNGPGLPTALCLGGKFVLIGTSRGLVLVFDCFEELRMILGHGKQIRSMADPVLGKSIANPNHALTLCSFGTELRRNQRVGHLAGERLLYL